MTTDQHTDLQAPDRTGGTAFDAYTASLDDQTALGYLVLYSIFDTEVTPRQIQTWFGELDLDPRFCPGPLRAVDAYEKVTGPDGVQVTYPLADPTATRPAERRAARRRGAGKTATLMVRPVRRDGGQIVRHVIREVRDADRTELTYDTRLAVVTFERDNSTGSPDGAGTMRIEPVHTAITQLPQAEQGTVHGMLTDVEAAYDRRRTYLSADRLRTVVRTYVEHLGAVRVRPTGGVYFVHRQHAQSLTALRTLVDRCGTGSHLTRIPLPDIGEMRQMIITAFTTQARDDLNRLAGDIATAQDAGVGDTEAQRLYHRFQTISQATDEHAGLLSASLDDTQSALALVKTQLGALLATAGK